MKNKSVLFVVHQLNTGGVQKALVTTLNCLDYEKLDVTLYIRKNRLDLLNEIKAPLKEIIINEDKTHYYRKPKAVLLSLISRSDRGENALNSYISSERMKNEHETYFKDRHFDIAIAYIQGYTSEFVSKYVNADRKYMFFHGSEDENHCLHEAIMPSFDRIIGVNSGVADFLRATYPKVYDKIGHLDNYVDYENVLRQSREFAIPKMRTTICTVGRMAEVKGFDLAVEAARILRNKGLDFQWYFVGDGPERGIVEALAKDYKLQDRIIFTGMQGNPYPYINVSDIYVQPSLAEAMPITLFEAQILCRPVVTTKTVGGMNIVKDGVTGLQVDIDPDSIAEGIMKLLNDPELVSSMVNELKKVDYVSEKERYRRGWAELLEG